MHRTVAAILIVLAGWTLTSNILFLAGGSLDTLVWSAPVGIAILTAIYLALPGEEGSTATPRPDALDGHPPLRQALFIGAALFTTLLLRFNWTAFWAAGVLILASHCVLARKHRGGEAGIVLMSTRMRRTETMVVITTMVAAALLALAVNRPDADDAFYVGIAAFTHAHPGMPLLGTDPMHGESGWPLLFPSYRFASYELFAGALAKLAGVPAMDIMYRALPPLGAAFVVLSAFYIARQMAPRRWLAMGVIIVALGLVLGESHRSFGNFVLVRIFQGKSIYVSALMPLIFALTFRCSSERGSARDVMLLACAQLAAIGLSNFGMLAAPMAAGTALAACAITAPPVRYRRLAATACTLIVSVPYLLYVAVAAHVTGDIQAPEEPAAAVWLHIFGPRQQYLAALLLLAAPALTSDSRARAWLAAPPLILLGVLLNPWLAHVISQSITTAPVYWRVTWCFPVLAYLAWALYATGEKLRSGPLNIVLGAATAALLVWCMMFSALRPDNGVSWQFAGLKVPASDYAVAERVMTRTRGDTRILAPEPVSSVIARFENHPRLVEVRDGYLSVLRPSIGEAAFAPRMRLQNFVNGNFQPHDEAEISMALNDLNVGTVVTARGETPVSRLLAADGYTLIDTLAPYAIWQRVPAAP